MVSSKLCESLKCSNLKNPEYGTGRFCSQTCARSFATMKSRNEINAKVSKKLKGRIVHNKARYVLIGETIRKNHLHKIMISDFDSLGRNGKRARILIEQENKCLWCELDTWNGIPIVLELDHEDGDRSNELRENLRLLCPNCHSQTPTWRRQKQAVVVQQTE